MRCNLGTVSATAFFLLAAGQCTQNATEGACPDVVEEQEETQLMQRAKARVSPPKNSAWQWTQEAFADLSFEDIGCTGKGGQDISQQCWAHAFAKLDRNNDGKLSAEDLHYKEDEERGSAKNLTRKDIRRGLALLSQWYPAEAPRLLMNEPLILSAAYRGEVPPQDAGDPEDPVAAVPERAPKANLLQEIARRGNATAVRELRGDACVDGVGQTVVASFGIAFSILGIELPAGSLIADAVTTNIKLVDGIIAIVKAMDSFQNAGGVALGVAQILQQLYSEGVFSAVVTKALDKLSWWEWAVVSAQVAGTVALWFTTGMASLVLQVAMVVLDAVELIQGMLAVQEHCF